MKNKENNKKNKTVLIAVIIIAAMLAAAAAFVIIFLLSGKNDNNSSEPGQKVEESRSSKSDESSQQVSEKMSDQPSKDVSETTSSEQSKTEISQKQESENSKDNSDSESSAAVPEPAGDNFAANSANYKISYPVSEYIYNYIVKSFKTNYGSNYFDSSKDLKTQYYSENLTWYDYFADSTKNYLERMLVLSEAAKEEGFELTEKDQEILDESYTNLENDAKNEGKTVEEYLADNYGSNISIEEFKEMQKMTVIVQNYYSYLENSITFTDDEYEDEYSNNRDKYDKVDYLAYSFPYNDSMSSDEKDKLKKCSEELAESKTQDEFREYLKKYLTENPDQLAISMGQESVDESNIDSAADVVVSSALNEAASYNSEMSTFNWIFSDERKENDISCIDENNAYNVVMIVKPVYRDETETRSVRHILITVTSDEQTAEARKKAESILEEWKVGEATDESFANLAGKYSEDPGSKNNGGLYNDVERGQMVEEFDNWLFSDARKAGDCDIIKTSFGFHVMYYSGVKSIKWKSDVDSVLRNRKLAEKYDKLKKQYPVVYNEELLKNITVSA